MKTALDEYQPESGVTVTEGKTQKRTWLKPRNTTERLTRC